MPLLGRELDDLKRNPSQRYVDPLRHFEDCVVRISHVVHPTVCLPPTDDAGRSESEGEVGTYTAWVLPKALQDPKALQEFYQSRAGQPDPTASVRQQVGTFTTRRGETVEVDLRLPPGWGQ